MIDNTKARSDEIAAKADKLVNKIDFNYQKVHPTLLATLYAQLEIAADCSHSTAVRHIKATLGLTNPIGKLKIALPIQRFNYRATASEAEWIKPELKAYAKKLLEELRNDT